MDPDFWHNKWQHNEIGFHNSEAHSLLLRYWPTLALSVESRVLVPLAGKSLDVRWLLEQGLAVTASELSETAAAAFFAEQGWRADISEHRGHRLYRHERLDYWVGDFFTLPEEQLSPVDAVYDRAALIALPPEMRQRYVDTLKALLKPGALYLLISLEYVDNDAGGPPFAVDGDAVTELFRDSFSIHCHGRHASEVKGREAFEAVYTLEYAGA